MTFRVSLFLVAAGVCLAQQQSQLTGIAKDQSGSPIASVPVSLHNAATGVNDKA